MSMIEEIITEFITNENLWPIFFGVLLLIFVYLLVSYLFMSFAFMSIAKKAKLSTPSLAWIPFYGPDIIAYQGSKLHWWPWLLLVVVHFISVIPLGFIISVPASLVFLVYSYIWRWKVFERVKFPGWFALLTIIPIIKLIVVGFVAWSKRS